jgi:hypothetical protein
MADLPTGQDVDVISSIPIIDAGAGKTLKSVPVSITVTSIIVAAVPGKRIKVYAIMLTTDATSYALRSGASTMLEGPIKPVGTKGFSSSVNPPAFLVATIAGDNLTLVTAGAGTTAGRISYWDDDST